MPLKVTKLEEGPKRTLTLDGDVDDNVDLDALFGAEIPAELRVICARVMRVNSIGTDHWIRYFKKAAAKGCRIVFADCSPIIVERFNSIRNFSCGGIVESAYLPYRCELCDLSFSAMFNIAQLRQIATAGEPPKLKCPKCGKPNTEFDDLPSEYFAFVKRGMVPPTAPRSP